MEVVARTQGGFLIEASKLEIEEILNAVTGKKPDEISIGQRIPAIDYASTIKKTKALRTNYEFKQIFEYLARFNDTATELKLAVENASEIEL